MQYYSIASYTHILSILPSTHILFVLPLESVIRVHFAPHCREFWLCQPLGTYPTGSLFAHQFHTSFHESLNKSFRELLRESLHQSHINRPSIAHNSLHASFHNSLHASFDKSPHASFQKSPHQSLHARILTTPSCTNKPLRSASVTIEPINKYGT